MQKKGEVLFLCTHNSARSQMAEGLMNSMYVDRFKAYSAGTHPTVVNPLAVRALAEAGIDISKSRAKSLEEYRGKSFDYVVTVCDNANEECPYFPGAEERIHQSFEDPSAAGGTQEERLAAFRRTRDNIREWLEKTFGKAGI